MGGDKMPWWTSDRAFDVAGIFIAVLPWGFPGPPVMVRIAVAVCCAASWIAIRRWTSSLEMPLAIISMSVIARLVVFVVS